MENKVRNSNFEILRIIAMLLIIAGHLTFQSGILNTDSNNKFFAVILGSGLGVADNIFVLISAYFLTNIKFSTKRILKIYLEVWTYTVPITIIMLFCGRQWIGIKDVIRSLFPYSGSPLWFATCYITMLLFSPFLNSLLNNRKLVKKILILLFFINVIPSTFLLRNDFFYSGESVYFCFLYLLMGYFKKYNIEENIKKIPKYIFGIVGAIIYVGIIVSYFGITFLGDKFSVIQKLCGENSLNEYFIVRYHTLPAFICSLCIVLFVINSKAYTNKFINLISGGVFSAYIIHQTPTFAPFMWKEIIKVDKWMYSKYYVIYYILSIIFIFIMGCSIGVLRKKILEPILIKSKIFEFLQRKLDDFYNTKDWSKDENNN